MAFAPRLERLILTALVATVAVVYVIAWLAPGFGLHRDDAVYLVIARALRAGHGYALDSLPTPIPQTEYPPLLAAMLTLFSLVSNNVQWLKLEPMACCAVWLWLTRKLLLKMGASRAAALAIVMLTAAAPITVFLATNLMPETLFAVLLTAALLLLLEERTWTGGFCAGLAFLTQTAGASLIAACVLILLVRKRLRGAAQFTAGAALPALPWLGWTGGAIYAPQEAITGLPASEKLVVMSNNLVSLVGSPFALLTNFSSTWTVVATAALAIWCLYKRRQLAPDLFFLLYMLTLDLRVGPPQHLVAPVLPLILWLVWRSVRTMTPREMPAGAVLILAGFTLFATLRQTPVTIRNGTFPPSADLPNDWKEMEKMFAWVRSNTPPDANVMANLDPLWYLNTGRKAIRGFTPDPYRTYYSPGLAPITAAGLSAEFLKSRPAYVVISPDRDFIESTSYTRAVEALERGGLLEAVDGVGLAHGYRLLRATGASTLR
jgi:hypothetical protein